MIHLIYIWIICSIISLVKMKPLMEEELPFGSCIIAIIFGPLTLLIMFIRLVLIEKWD